MGVAQDNKVIRKLREPGQPGAVGENIFLERLPGAGVHHEYADPRGLACERDRGCGENVQQFWRKLGLTFAEIGRIATTKQDHLMVALDALGLDVL